MPALICEMLKLLILPAYMVAEAAAVRSALLAPRARAKDRFSEPLALPSRRIVTLIVLEKPLYAGMAVYLLLASRKPNSTSPSWSVSALTPPAALYWAYCLALARALTRALLRIVSFWVWPGRV